MSRKLIATCDRCKRDLPVLEYRVQGHLSVNASSNGAPTNFDVCDECAGDLKKFLGQPDYAGEAPRP